VAQRSRGRSRASVPCTARSAGGKPRTRHLATEDRELMTQDRDLDVLLVRGRADSHESEQLSNEQEGD